VESVDWMIRERLLIMGVILIVIGLVLYLFKGPDTLVLSAIGAVLLIAGFIYDPKPKAPRQAKTHPVKIAVLLMSI
jgi:uncharacterized protein YjeT (DUF2065 family)